MIAEGLINNTDTVYSSLAISTINLPTFLDGVNTIEILNNNASGPGGSTGLGLDGTIDLLAVPEPASIAIWLLLGVSIGSFGFFRLRKRA